MDGQAMNTSTSQETEGTVFDPVVANVSSWRREQLTRAGYSRELARSLSQDHAVDLHRACDLLLAGCPEEVAYEILV